MEDNKNIRISKLSFVAFSLFLLGVMTYFGGVCLLGTKFIPEGKEYLIMAGTLFFQISALIVSIIDLLKKKEEKYYQ